MNLEHLESVITEIQNQIRTGQFKNEAEVKQGIVLRILDTLDWKVFDARIVSPEYALESRRVDYALCHPQSVPKLLIEVKDIGNAGGAERQLFEYAFHKGIPMAILTDGQEWSFFLPGEQGDYQERCVYKLDLLTRPVDESAKRFQRYLAHDEVTSGRALQAARDDYRNVSTVRTIQTALPEAWKSLLEEEDELLLELLADKVQSLTGFKPTPDTVANFITERVLGAQLPVSVQQRPVETPITQTYVQERTHTRSVVRVREFNSVRIQGSLLQATSAKGVMIKVLGEFQRRDPSFLERFAALPRHGRRRRYISRNKMELYPGRPDLCEEYSEQNFGGWWVGTNYSSSTIAKIIRTACEVAGFDFGSDVTLV